MKMKLRIANCELRTPPVRLGGWTEAHSSFEIRHSKLGRAFTLVEVLVVMVLLSLIVLALMAVFNSTQTAFRASVTQSGVLEDGRATMDLLARDLRAMAPSDGVSNSLIGAANFSAGVSIFSPPPSPLVQPMVGGNSVRTNVVEGIFILGRGNQNGAPVWTGVGYAVATNVPPGSLYALYRFYAQTNIQANPRGLFNAYLAEVTGGQWANMSHLMDGVVSLTVLPCDVNGGPMTTNIVNAGGLSVTNQNVLYLAPLWGQTGFVMFSNTLPVSVQIEMGVLEDRALRRAESLPDAGANSPQARYLVGSASRVHVFRQRVWIPNADPSAFR
jgi:prepilin-type N-terminal cleavage/methylation domain-containing protein